MKHPRPRIRPLILILILTLPLLSGCSLLPHQPDHPAEKGASGEARLEIRLDAMTPDAVTVAWDPAAVAVDSAEVRVSGGPSGSVVVTVRLAPER